MEEKRKWNIDPAFIPESEDLSIQPKYEGDWSKPTPLTVDRDWFYGTLHEVICVFGSWHVTIKGDIIHIGTKDRVNWYPIWSEQLFDNDNDDWVLHLTEKGWFTDKCYEDFKRAYFVACKIAGAEPAKQIRNYSERKKK